MRTETAAQEHRELSIVISPYTLKHLFVLRIEHHINDHVRLWINAELRAGDESEIRKGEYFTNLPSPTTIEVNYLNVQGEKIKTVFAGIITGVSLKAGENGYLIDAQAVSYTSLLDIKRKNRSFQDKKKPYRTLLDEIEESYANAVIIDTASGEKTIDRFILQHNETDWEFLKRLASHLGVGLVADGSISRPRFSFGMPQSYGQVVQEEELEIENMSIHRRSENYWNGRENERIEFLSYEIDSRKELAIGDKVALEGQTMIVYQSTMYLKNKDLCYCYLMAPGNVIRQNWINDQLYGVTYTGKIIEVQDNKVKVHFDIDEHQERNTACWFPYVSPWGEGVSTWHSVPSAGDTVEVYFPSNDAERGKAVPGPLNPENKASQNRSSAMKYFHATTGRELKVNEKEIVITGRDNAMLVRLNERGGIEINSDKMSVDDLKIEKKKTPFQWPKISTAALLFLMIGVAGVTGVYSYYLIRHHHQESEAVRKQKEASLLAIKLKAGASEKEGDMLLSKGRASQAAAHYAEGIDLASELHDKAMHQRLADKNRVTRLLIEGDTAMMQGNQAKAAKSYAAMSTAAEESFGTGKLLTRIKARIEASAAMTALIAEADTAFKEKKYTQAKNNYAKAAQLIKQYALAVSPSGMTEIQEKLKMANQQISYQTARKTESDGDRKFNTKQYRKAGELYAAARAAYVESKQGNIEKIEEKMRVARKCASSRIYRLLHTNKRYT